MLVVRQLPRLHKFYARAAVDIVPDEAATICLVGAVLPEQNDQWQAQNRYMQTNPRGEFAPRPMAFHHR